MLSTPRLWTALAVCGLSCSSAGPLELGQSIVLPAHPKRTTSFTSIPTAKIRKQARVYPVETRFAPLSLTASDGTGLRLVELRARGVIAGPLAVTQLEARFDNPEDRILEGRFTVTLPPGAAVSRLAMRIDDRWQEAEVVERQAARRAYEDFLHRRQDPMLLERDAGNRFQARVFPIPARGSKEIVLSYSQELVASGGEYRIPLAGLPEIAELEIDVTIEGVTGAGGNLGYLRTDAAPDGDFVVSAPAATVGLRAGDLVAARILPPIPAAVRPIESLLVLFDTSASQALVMPGQVDGLGELLATLAAVHGDDTRILVAAFDQTVEPLFLGRAGEVSSATLDALRERRPLGASDLAGALAFARQQRGFSRILLVTDGVATAGAIETAELRAEAAALAPRIRRLDAICVGGGRDSEALSALVRGVLAEDGVVLDPDLSAKQLVQSLTAVAVSGIELAVADADWVYPRRIDGVQPGDAVLVVARRRPGADPDHLAVTLNGPLERRVVVDLLATEPALLERTLARARIRELTELRDRLDPDRTEERARLRAEITELSIAHRVVADTTALLVLETEEDYARFGLARRALADILTVGPGGLQVIDKRWGKAAFAAPGRVARAAGDPPAATEAAPELPAPEAALMDRATEPLPTPAGAGGESAEVVTIDSRAPTIDPTSTTHGVTLDIDGSKNIPMPGRTFEVSLGRAAGSTADDLGLSFSGSTSLENLHVVDGVNAGEVILFSEGVGVAGDCPADSVRVVDRLGERVEVTCRHHDGRVVPARRRGHRVSQGSTTAPAPRLARPYAGAVHETMAMLDHGRSDDALVAALARTTDDPGDVMALVTLGQVLESRGEVGLAARAYGSLIDLFPSRADLRRFAGERLERLGERATDLAADSFAKAVADRPDHLSGHRLLGYALLRQGRPDHAFAAIEDGLYQPYPAGRFLGVESILREDLGLIGAAWLAGAPDRKKEILARLDAAGVALATSPSTRFVLHWETDANDVDLHIRDGAGFHAFYSQPTTGEGRLYADVTTGYGPECFATAGAAAAYPYQIGVHYYARGPMGYGMGKVEIIQHDGHGELRFRELPFVVMNDGAFVELGQLDRPL